LSSGKPLVTAAPSAASTRAIHELVRKMQQTQLLQKLSGLKKPSRAQLQAAQKGIGGMAPGAAASREKEQAAPRVPGQVQQSSDPWSALKLRVHKELVEKIDFKK